jgi:Ca2+-binding RTX toxin-like protein
VDYSRRTDNLTLRLDGSGPSGDLAAGEADTFTNIRNVLGGLGNDTIIGNNSNDFASGGTGSDSITGGTGNDAIVGGLGADTVNAAAGHNAVLLKGDGSIDHYTANPGGAALDIDAVDATDVLTVIV